MRNLIIILLCALLPLTVAAQAPDKGERQGRFSPEKFDRELRQFIISEAHLTTQEAEVFFPVYQEMQQKQRTLFERQRSLGREKPQSEQGCRAAIRERDEIDISLRKVQQEYHTRFLDLLPASKVYDIIKAEEHFHRRSMKNWGGGHRPPSNARK